MKNSKLFTLNVWDFLKGLVVAILTPVILYAQVYYSGGNLDIPLKALLAAALSGFLAYLIKNFFSDAPALPKVSATIGDEENGVVGHRPNDR